MLSCTIEGEKCTQVNTDVLHSIIFASIIIIHFQMSKYFIVKSGKQATYGYANIYIIHLK